MMKLQRRLSSPSCRLIDSPYHVGGPHPRRVLCFSLLRYAQKHFPANCAKKLSC